METIKVRVGNYCNVSKSIELQYVPSASCLPVGSTTTRVQIPGKESGEIRRGAKDDWAEGWSETTAIELHLTYFFSYATLTRLTPLFA